MAHHLPVVLRIVTVLADRSFWYSAMSRSLTPDCRAVFPRKAGVERAAVDGASRHQRVRTAMPSGVMEWLALPLHRIVRQQAE